MRFIRLEIPAFGLFRNVRLSFPGASTDFQLIHGPNEAGKSTLLRAFRDLLFGIPGRTSDNFLHDNRSLRILGEIENASGQNLVFQRRKGNRDTLLDEGGTPLPDTSLRPFLENVDARYFSAMFGLGPVELHDGAEELLRGEGVLGNALFSASMGGTSVERILRALDEESEKLYKGRSTSGVSIRPLLGKRKDLLKRVKDAQVKPEAWESVECELATAKGSKGKLDSEMQALSNELGWLNRCSDALPSVLRLSETIGLLKDFQNLPTVASDFVTRAREVRAEVRATSTELGVLNQQIESLQAQLDQCKMKPGVLELANELDLLHQGVGNFRNRKAELVTCRQKLYALQAEIESGIKRLGISGSISDLEERQVTSVQRLKIGDAATAFEKASLHRNSTSRTAAEMKEKLKAEQRQLKSLPDENLDALRNALALAAEATDANKTVDKSSEQVNQLLRQVNEQHRQLQGAPADLEATCNLQVPAKATIRSFKERFSEIRQEIKKEQAGILDGNRRIDTIKGELQRIQRRGELPTLASLEEARRFRDRGWQLVLDEWKGSGAREELVADTPLERSFPEAIQKADSIADALRDEAEAVAQVEEKNQQISKSGKLNAEASQRISDFEKVFDATQQEWLDVWRPLGVTPKSPDEMDEWREVWLSFKSNYLQLDTARESLERKQNQLKAATESLARVLERPVTQGFASLFEEARRRVQECEQRSGRKGKLLEDIDELQRRIAQTESEFAGATEEYVQAANSWKAACREFGFPEDATPEIGRELLREQLELLNSYDQWKQIRNETSATEASIREFDDAIQRHAESIGVTGDSTEALESALWNSLLDAMDVQSRIQQLSGQLNETRDKAVQQRLLNVVAEEAMRQILNDAKLDSPEGLETLLGGIESRTRLTDKIDELRTTLIGLARGQDLEHFVKKVLEEDVETIESRKRTIESELQEKEQQLDSIRAQITKAESELARLEKAGDEAANFLQDSEMVTARLLQDASRFIRLRLAIKLLQSRIEQFRRENQGPLLQRSGEIFREITCGSFSGLDAEFNNDDVPMLVGRRVDNSTVSVDGMSSGTRDQLFLALRMAALEKHISDHEPMPLILDDLLITFDDERSEAILRQLAEFSTKTQVLLFTHHQHIVDLCQRTLAIDSRNIHNLASRRSSFGISDD